MEKLWSLLLTKHYSGDQKIKKNVMDGARGTYEEEERCMRGFVGGLMEKEQLGDLDQDGSIILKLISKSGMGRHGLD